MHRCIRIVIPEPDSRVNPFAQRLERWADSVCSFETPYRTIGEVAERKNDADAVLVTGGTGIDAGALRAAGMQKRDPTPRRSNP